MRITYDMVAQLKDHNEVVEKLRKKLGRIPTEDEILEYYGIVNNRKQHILIVLAGGAGSNMYQPFDELLTGVEWADVEYLFIDSFKRQDFISKVVSEGSNGFAKYIPMDVVKGEPIEVELEKKKLEIISCLRAKDIVVISAGLGGFIGSNVAPYVAVLAKSLGTVKTIMADVSLPLKMEGKDRAVIAQNAIDILDQNSNESLIIDMDVVIGEVDRRSKINELFDGVNKQNAGCVVSRLKEICGVIDT